MRMPMAVFAAAAFTISATASALASPDDEPPWSGPFVSVGPSAMTLTASTPQSPYAINQLSGINIQGRGVVIVPGTLVPEPDRFGTTATMASFRAGYAKQVRHLVLGVEASVAAGRSGGTSSWMTVIPQTAVTEGVFFGQQRSIAVASSISLRARVGIAARRELVYAFGGPAWVNAVVGGTETFRADPAATVASGPCPGRLCAGNIPVDAFSATTSGRQLHTGTVLGVGWAHHVSRHTTIGIEWSRASLGARDYDFNNTLVESCSVTIPNVTSCGAGIPGGGGAVTAKQPVTLTATSLELQVSAKLR